MENLTFGLLLILLLFILLPLLNWLVRQMRRRRRATGSGAEKQAHPPVPAGTEKIVAKVETKPRRERAAAAPMPITSARRSRSQTMRRRLTNNREVRRGIISLTVLGPCRALEPPE